MFVVCGFSLCFVGLQRFRFWFGFWVFGGFYRLVTCSLGVVFGDAWDSCCFEVIIVWLFALGVWCLRL